MKIEEHYWYKLSQNSKRSNQDKIIDMMRAGYKMYESCVEYDDKVYNIAKVSLNGYVTLFIEGHALMTIYEYSPFKAVFQFKMSGGGDWVVNGERRREYDQFMVDVCKALNFPSLPCFEEDTRNYMNVISVTDNGCHPFGVSGISIKVNHGNSL